MFLKKLLEGIYSILYRNFINLLYIDTTGMQGFKPTLTPMVSLSHILTCNAIILTVAGETLAK